jgi:hypothetical protein
MADQSPRRPPLLPLIAANIPEALKLNARWAPWRQVWPVRSWPMAD